MKNFKKVVCLLVLLTVLCNGIGMEAKAWGPDVHKSRVEDVVTKRLNPVNGSGKEINLLYITCQMPDDKLGDNKTSKYPGAFHGKGNYVVKAKYLYELSFTYLNTKTAVNDRTFIDNYYNSCSYIPQEEQNNIKEMNNSLVKLLSTVIRYDSNYETHNRRKSIKIMGFECHLIGDMFAHDTIVPRGSINGTNENMKFHESDFSNANQWKTFKNIILNYEIRFADLNNLHTARGKNSSGTIVKLSTIYDSNLLTAIEKNLESGKFEDNPDFYPSAYNGTFTVTKNILYKYNAALKASKTQTVDTHFDKNMLNYYSDGNKLYNFEGFMSSVN